MTAHQVTALLAAAVTAGTPLVFAGLGELLAERSGVLNLGVEGMMLVGAVSGFAVAAVTRDPWFAVAAAVVAGGGMAAGHAFLTVTLGADQVSAGLSLALFGGGLSAFLGKPFIGIPNPVPFRTAPVPGLSAVPLIGPVRTVVAIFSYDGGLYFGVTGDADSAPDIDVLTGGIERGMAELLALVAQPEPPEPDRATTTA